MSIQQVLTTIYDSSYWRKTPITCFMSPTYPYFFVKKLLTKLEYEKIMPLPRSRVQLSTQDPKALLPLLQQTILGQASFFWLGDIEEGFATKQKETFLNGLNGYSGENRIVFFAHEIPTKTTLAPLTLPSDIEINEGIALATIFAPKVIENSFKRAILERLFKQNAQLPLNLFMNILDNLDLIQTKHLETFYTYLSPLLPLTAELSNLSQAFFKRDLNFFKMWSILSSQYPPIFWVAFWNDQWWRAFHLVSFARQKNIVLAKKMGFKLPYSFINKDWENYQPTYFRALLAQLYTIDYNIKRGHSFCFFDYLYAQHFVRTKK